jgi:hypothetical protein
MNLQSEQRSFIEAYVTRRIDGMKRKYPNVDDVQLIPNVTPVIDSIELVPSLFREGEKRMFVYCTAGESSLLLIYEPEIVHDTILALYDLVEKKCSNSVFFSHTSKSEKMFDDIFKQF